ncbi:2,5-dioxovalerate dehydrogenase [Pokkaliibacter plantistimulans]|uniref:2,5-dioxovalerate dehydrogenase n=1 Tax=Pokkaliibacter plantistimulans TaxID=1635171 RepID=A0ABX5LTU7_9GAMM|nr:aldehyde dehydrogenase (NADP(+)) [Pokkaliibacter plantistimulans]PXF30072.1 2,5-dioxovalerate dehydrogenase [Pokkaliibacter plantistimulans]
MTTLSSAQHTLTGAMYIGARRVVGQRAAIHAINPATAETLQPAYGGGDSADVDHACQLASQAFASYRRTGLAQRAAFLEQIAEQILALGDELIVRAMAETGLPRARLEGERGRTVGQLRLFAEVVRAGDWLDARIDPALPERTPLPRPDLRQRQVPLGPVAVFGASNFPLAFSVAGGDTASALAAGAPVVVKAHSAHPGTAELVAHGIRQAVRLCDLHEGVFSMLYGSGQEVGTALVAHPAIKAVGFTGSRAGGTALMRVAANRKEPIPVYAEMSSINPVFLLPAALQQRADSLAQGFAGSLLMGAGQFCTNPGLVVAIEGDGLQRFIDGAQQALASSSPATMLTPGICRAYSEGVSTLAAQPQVDTLARGLEATGPNQCQAALFSTTAEAFLAEPDVLGMEVFGSSSLLIKCRDEAEMLRIAEHLEGQLTATLQLQQGADTALLSALLDILELKAGRILANGYPTGVEVCHAMVHGGPFPATSDSRTTSVGSAAIKRFLRPVCYQDIPDTALPEALQQANPLALRRMVNGGY